MKVLLICLILAVRCEAEENSNDTITTTVERPKFEIKLIDEPEGTVDSRETNTVATDSNKTEITDKNVRKKLVKVKKLKKITNTAFQNDASYKVHEENNDSKKTEAEFGSKFPETLLPSNVPNYLLDNHVENVNSDTQTESSVKNASNDNNYRPDRVSGRWNKQKFNVEEAKFQNPYKIVDSHYEESRTSQESNFKPKNTVKFAYKIETYPQESRTVSKHEKPSKKQRRGGKPSLPEIQNVIQTLDDSHATNNAYQSPKQNQIVEVTQVPLVYEHHYEGGGYADPQTKLVTHQYSYSPPADHSDEAYQLGKLLSKNVVQKLQSSQRPLKEYIEGHQEVVLRRPVLKPVGYSHPYLRTPIRHSHYLHPLMKYLEPEITHENFLQDIQQFKTLKLHPQHFVVPQKTHVIQPVVVEEEPPKHEFETTYLQAINRPSQFENQPQTSSHVYGSNTPYPTKVQQQFVEVPKYTMVSYLNLQDDIKPQALHEVEPPNLSELKKYKNLHYVKTQETPNWPTSHAEIIKNTEQQQTLVPIHKEPYVSQGHEFGNKLKLENIITNQGLVHYAPVPHPIYHHPKIQMVQSRPYWRKPVMKLVRVPHYQNYQQVVPKYRSPHVEEPMIETYSDGTPVVYQNIEAQYSNPNINVIKSNEIQQNPETSVEYSNNLRQQEVELVVASENNGNTGQVQGLYTLDDKKQENPQEIYYIQNQENPKEELKYEVKENDGTTKDKQTATEVELVKSITPQYIEIPQNNNPPETISYAKPQTIEEGPQIIEMPKTYLRYRGQRSRPRAPIMHRPEHMRHVMPLIRPREKEMNDDFKGKYIYPKLRSLVSDLMGKQGNRDVDFVVFMKENREI